MVRGHPRSSASATGESVFNRNYASILYRFGDTASYLSKFADFTLPHLHLEAPLGVTPFEFRKDFWHQKTRLPRLSCGVVCVILCIAVLIQYWLVADRHTTHTQTHGHGIYRAEHSSRGKNSAPESRRPPPPVPRRDANDNENVSCFVSVISGDGIVLHSLAVSNTLWECHASSLAAMT